MPNEPVWLPLKEVVETNRQIVMATGEPFVVPRPELLDSALAKPRNKFAYGEEDMVNLATCLLFAIARNHPFAQGNKRTALVAADNFLGINGYSLDMRDSEEFGALIVDCLEGRLTEAAFARAIRPHVARISSLSSSQP